MKLYFERVVTHFFYNRQDLSPKKKMFSCRYKVAARDVLITMMSRMAAKEKWKRAQEEIVNCKVKYDSTIDSSSPSQRVNEWCQLKSLSSYSCKLYCVYAHIKESPAVSFRNDKGKQKPCFTLKSSQRRITATWWCCSGWTKSFNWMEARARRIFDKE